MINNNDNKKAFNEMVQKIGKKFHFPREATIAILSVYLDNKEISAEEVIDFIVDNRPYEGNVMDDKFNWLQELKDLLEKIFDIRSVKEGTDIPLWMLENAVAGIDRRKEFLQDVFEGCYCGLFWEHHLGRLVEKMGQLNSERLARWVLSWFTCHTDKAIEQLSRQLDVEYWEAKRLWFLRQEAYPIRWSTARVLGVNGLYRSIESNEKVADWLKANIVWIY